MTNAVTNRACLLLAATALLPTCSGGNRGTVDTGRYVFGFPLDAVAPSTLMPVDAFPSLRFDRPVFVTHAGDGTDRLFVVEQAGRIWVFDNDPAVASASLFLDIRHLVTANTGEQGLLGLAFAPDYATSGRFFVYYMKDGPLESLLAGYQVSSGDPDVADPGSEQILLRIAQPFSNHNAGMIAFGPDDMLYVALGDGGSGGDPLDHGQDPTTLLGSLLRIDPSGGTPYAIPPDNPFVGSAGGERPEIWAYGFRNPWRFSFDRQNGELWLGDVGQNMREEIDVVVRGGNYGWNVYEGNREFDNPGNLPPSAFAMPVHDYAHDLGVSVTGGYVYRGTALPQLRGSYLFADFVSGRVWTLLRNGATADVAQVATVPLPASFGEDEAGELLIASHDGPLYRLENATPGAATFPRTLAATGLFTDLASLTPAPGLVEYEVNAPFWSDGAGKRRWLASPLQPIPFAAADPWELPVGAVLVKHFELATTVGDPGTNRRLETRVLVHEAAGWAGYSYRWNEQGTEATLLGGRADVSLSITDPMAPGGTRTQQWTFPSGPDCRQCHTAAAGPALGIRTGQLRRTAFGRDQLQYLSSIGLLTGYSLPGAAAAWVDPEDTSAPLEARARSWLATNCAQCHLPGGPTGSAMDLRYATATAATGVLDAMPQFGDLGIVNARIVAPGDHARSVLWERVRRRDAEAMPPLGSHEVDAAGAALLATWIDSL